MLKKICAWMGAAYIVVRDFTDVHGHSWTEGDILEAYLGCTHCDLEPGQVAVTTGSGWFAIPRDAVRIVGVDL